MGDKAIGRRAVLGLRLRFAAFRHWFALSTLISSA